MPQKNAFIIDEDREFAKRVAAALRTDQLKVTIAEGDRDPLDETYVERPDIILMRADSRDGESGFALCSRIKQQGRLGNVPVFLYSAEADDQTFEHHRHQEGAADAYMHFPAAPPYPMDDLKARVEEALASSTTDVSVEIDLDEDQSDDEDGPPPLPAKDPLTPTSEEDNAFLDRVLDSLQQGTVEEETSPIPPLRAASVSARRTTADAKLDMLRQKLRQREFELAKVMEMYRAKEREYHEWNERLVEKDVEAQALKVTIEDHQRTAEIAQGELDRRTSEFNASFEQLLEEKVSRENELIHTVAVKEKELADVNSRLLRAQREAEKLKGELSAIHTKAEQAAESHRETLNEIQTQLEDRESALASLEQALADTQDQVAELEQAGEDKDRDLRGRSDALLDLQDLILSLRADLADAREALDEATETHNFELQSFDELVNGLKSDLDEAEASFTQLESDLKGEVAELTVELQAQQERLRAKNVAQSDMEAAYRSVQLRAAAREVELDGRFARLRDTLDAERADRADAEAQLDAEAQQAQRKITNLQDSITDLEMVSGERIRVLGEQVDERDDRITQIRESLEEERDRFREVEAALKETVADLEARRLRLQAEVDERLADLAETEANHAETVAARDAIQSRLEEELRVANDEVASLNAEVGDLQNHLEELEQTRVHMEAEFQQELEDRANVLVATREAAGAKEAQLQDQITNLDLELSARGEQIDTLTVQLETERRERDDAERIIATLQLDLEGAKGELMNAEQVIRDKDGTVHELRETIAVREGRIVELQNEQNARQAELDHLRGDRDAKNEKIGRLEGQLVAQEEAIENLKSDGEHRGGQLVEVQELVAQLRSQLAVSQASVEDRTSRLNEARVEWTALREELVAERRSLSQRFEALQRDLEETRSARDALAADNARLEEQRDSLQQTEEDLRVDIEARRAYSDSIDRELEEERGARRAAEQAIERLRAELDDTSRTAQMASETAGNHQRDLEAQVEALTGRHAETVAESEQVRRTMTTELEQARARIDALTAQVEALSAARDGLGDEASHLSKQLDDAVTRSSSLATEKSGLEDQLRAQTSVLSDKEAEAARLTQELTDVRREREDIENKYVRELEELHDEYMQKAQETDAGHAREVESLRKAALDAKRQLKTSQLSAQRLEDRLRRLEAERPARKDASADFESFIAQFSDGSSGARKGPHRGRGTGDLPAAANASRPPASPAAHALSTSASAGSADKDDEVTDVSGVLSSPSARRATSNDRSPTKRDEPDDFLAAFDKEFEDIKGS